MTGFRLCAAQVNAILPKAAWVYPNRGRTSQARSNASARLQSTERQSRPGLKTHGFFFETGQSVLILRDTAKRLHERDTSSTFWDTSMEIVIYKDAIDHEPLVHWLNAQRDVQARRLIWARIARIQLGSFGDCKHYVVAFWNCVSTMNLGTGLPQSPGAVRGSALCGSDKGDQSRRLNDAVAYLADWKSRGES